MKLFGKVAIVAAGLGVLGTGIAFGPAVAAQGGWGKMAGHGGKGFHRMIKRFDADNNGELTLQELENGRSERFKKADTNGDGVVTADELKARIMQRMERRADRRVKRMIRRLDEDRNGQVTEAEYLSRAKERFTWADLNDDGKLSGD
ncbi:MAG: EF-hand domain-containing protein, partial [Pseudomonadota bacterium]